ncbi:polysaccharide deacetylase family protein [Halobium salinum]|uniref:Polysaccharide deacetylase family protein n=1 Tax=Halobium salinum TaxID=1364940 RepID=A0ABD5PA65_9EURY|nr:polysaccharide deacetylase family protein [Halobium salinum]
MASDRNRTLRRRAYLASAGAAGATLLAGCGGSAGQSANTTGTENNTSTTATTSSSTTAGNATAGNETASGNETAGGAGEGQVDVSSLPGGYEPMTEQAAQFEDLSAWAPDSGVELTAETEDVYTGSQSAHVKGSGGTIRRDFPVPIDLTNKDISFAIKVNKPRPTNVRIWMRDTDNKQIKLIQQINPVPGHPDGWLRVQPSINDAAGTTLKAETMMITVDNIDGTAPDYLIDDLRFTPKQAKKGKVLFTFDDITPSLYTDIFPVMQEFGFKGTVGVIADAIGDSGRLNQSQLDEMKNAGWEFASHSNDFSALAGMDPSAQKKKVEYSKRIIKERGLGPVNSFMYPGGQVDRSLLETVEQNHDFGFLAFKGSEKGLSQSAILNRGFVNRSRPDTADAVENQLKEAAAYKGLYTIYMHGVDDGDEFTNTKSEFRNMCKRVQKYVDQGKVEVAQPKDLTRLDGV